MENLAFNEIISNIIQLNKEKKGLYKKILSKFVVVTIMLIWLKLL